MGDTLHTSLWPRFFFTGLASLSFLVLLARLVDVSLIRGGYYQTLAQQNRIRALPVYAPRGLLFDRTGAAFVENEETKRVARFEQGKPVEFTDKEEATHETEVVIPSWKRVYPLGEAVAHIVGYIGQVSKDEVGEKGCLRPGGGVSDPEGQGSVYELGDLVGRMGAEKAFDCQLRGKNGEELVEVDAKGNKVRVLGRREPEKGQDIILSLDAGLQKAARSALGEKRGAIVALSPRTGEVLALVSSPTFNPDTISVDYPKLSTDPNIPLFNRALGGAYPPGSTFKIVTAAAGLEEGKIDERTTFVDPGVLEVGGQKFANWYFTQYGKTEGEINLVRAITRSTDTFFYKVGEWVGVDKLSDWANKFGLGEKTEIGLGGETAGLVPSPSWKERVKGERWFLGNTYHLSIGQADLTASPLQITRMTAVIANGGKLCKPTIQSLVTSHQSPACNDVGLSQETINLISQGMIGACSPGGTAFPLFDFKVKSEHEPADAPPREIQVACKTGTAQFGDPQDRTHAWLTAFAPAPSVLSAVEGQPEIVVTALIEAGGEGSYVAAPVVKQVLEEWFSR
ncbi:hypothetical protein HYV21_01840 [Candidatus Microgenomates bacterium]|nr:hypothetical protein [Candidatus Microgenomates bacterium]